MSDRYQGDPKLTLDENGANLTFKGGQPVMDQGLENAALISLHTRKGWAGNAFARKPEQKLGSDFEESQQAPITLSAFNDVRNAAEAAFRWMIDVGIALSATARVSNPTGRRIDTAILVRPPSQDPFVLLDTKNGLNWIAQKKDPAYLKV